MACDSQRLSTCRTARRPTKSFPPCSNICRIARMTARRRVTIPDMAWTLAGNDRSDELLLQVNPGTAKRWGDDQIENMAGDDSTRPPVAERSHCLYILPSFITN